MSIDLGALLSAAGEHCANVNQALTTLEAVRALLKQGRYPGELADQVLKLSRGLGEAHVQAARLEAEIFALKKDLDMNEKLAARKQRYVLAPTPEGELVYTLKADADPPEPPHHVCPGCYERDQIRILQPRGYVLQCLECSATYRHLPDPGPPRVDSRRDAFDGYL